MKKPLTSKLSRAGFLVAPTAILIFTLVGCSRETTVYSDPQDEVTTTATPAPLDPISTDGRSVLPKGFFNQSVNQAIVDVAADGANFKSRAVRLQTFSAVNIAGGFNGNGEGNRAILGLAGYGDKPLTDLTSDFSFDAKVFKGSEQVSALLLVDPLCDKSALKVFVADASALGSGASVAGGYTRFTAQLNEAKWRVNGSAVVDPNDASVTLIPSTSSNDAPVPLTDFISKFPSACLRNTASGDEGLPKDIPTAAVLFVLGKTTTTEASGAFLSRIALGSDLYEGLE